MSAPPVQDASDWRSTMTCEFCNAQDATTCRDSKMRDAAMARGEAAWPICLIRHLNTCLGSAIQRAAASKHCAEKYHAQTKVLQAQIAKLERETTT